MKYVRVDEDQREYQRICVNLPVGLARDEANYDGSAIDISIRGCTVRTDEPLALASIVKIALRIPNEANPVVVDAAIVRSTSEGRIGLEFLRFQGNERQRLRQFVQGLLASQSQELSYSQRSAGSTAVEHSG